MTTKELLALVGKATPGPWRVVGNWLNVQAPANDNNDSVTTVCVMPSGGYRDENEINFALIVAAVNALPALCAEVEALQRQVGLLRETLGRAEEYLPLPPERNCSCHLSPPCGDCVDYSDLRDLYETIAPLIKEPK